MVLQFCGRAGSRRPLNTGSRKSNLAGAFFIGIWGTTGQFRRGEWIFFIINCTKIAQLILHL